MTDILKITKALADENRLRIIAALEGKELCVCQLIDLLGLAPSTVSKHLWILKNARLADARKAGRWIYYRLAGREAAACVKDALRWILESASNYPQIQADKRKLEEILNTDIEALCRRRTTRRSYNAGGIDQER